MYGTVNPCTNRARKRRKKKKKEKYHELYTHHACMYFMRVPGSYTAVNDANFSVPGGSLTFYKSVEPRVSHLVTDSNANEKVAIARDKYWRESVL